MQKAISIFTNSAGALLLALASALFLINWASPADYVPPHEPIFLFSIRDLFWIGGGTALVLALMCFFNGRPALPIFLLAWFAVNFWIYRIGLLTYGCHSLTGFLGGFSFAFGISARATDILIDIISTYLLFGSLVALWAVRRLPALTQFEKMTCPSCGARVKFAIENLGQQIPCPHCRTTITLQAPSNLKMSCMLCGGHIAFPTHAVGQKIPCPHCSKAITLLNPA